jgi:hypothetical protein
MKLLTTLLLTTILLLPLQSTFAQTNSETAEELEKWYQVELLIYSTTNNELAGEEQWPKSQTLQYPKHLQALVDNKGLNNDENTTADRHGNLIPESSLQENYSPIIETEFNTEQQQEQEQPFILLDPSEHQLTKTAKKLSRKPNFKILFHESWRQALTERKLAASILIRGGEQYGQHYELEGSIRFSVERYIHIDTDLWLSSFGNKLAVDDNPWNILPTAYIRTSVDGEPDSLLDQQYSKPFQNLLADDFSVLQTIVMRQHRRMRSKELHYIDHPLMGLLVRIIPYERPVLEETIEELPESTVKL